jgi:hypothetical protein
MRITFVGHASILVESGNIALLTDPWWNGPCFGAQWWIHPVPFLDVLDKRKLTHIYISHGHNDHLHPGTLARFSRDTKMLVARDLRIAPALEAMGFTVMQLPDGETVDLGSSVKATIRPTISGDSLLVVSDSREVCVNLNDALHATPEPVQDRFIAWLKEKFPVIDYVFCGYGTASHFPNCYRIPGKDDARTAIQRQHHFNTRWARIIQELGPTFAFPFAADVALLEKDLFALNEPVHNSERPVQLLSRSGIPNATQAVDIGPGFTVENGEITRDIRHVPVSNNTLLELHKAQIEKANYYPEVALSEVQSVLPLLQRNLNTCEEYLATFPGDYKVLLRFRNSAHGIAVEKVRKKIAACAVPADSGGNHDYDLVFTTRLPYLRRSLDSEYGNEIMFVGSGCLFELTDMSVLRRRIHEDVRCLVKRQNACPPPRYGGSNPLVFKSKQLVKRVLGMEEEDLYDLEKWTVFANDNGG